MIVQFNRQDELFFSHQAQKMISCRWMYILLPVVLYVFCFGLLEWTFHIHGLLPASRNETVNGSTERHRQTSEIDSRNNTFSFNDNIESSINKNMDRPSSAKREKGEPFDKIDTNRNSQVLASPYLSKISNTSIESKELTRNSDGNDINRSAPFPKYVPKHINTLVRMSVGSNKTSHATLGTNGSVSSTLADDTRPSKTPSKQEQRPRMHEGANSIHRQEGIRERQILGDRQLHDKFYLTDAARDELSIYGRTDLMDTSRNCTQRPPQCIIIGVMKAGTEAFSRYLLLHPRIAMQINMHSTMFFTQNYQYGWNWYINQMMCSSDGQVTMEKAPQYFSSAVAVQRIKRRLPDVKVIIMVRDPIHRAVSHYLQVKSIHPELIGGKSFEEMVFNSDGSVNGESLFIKRSCYMMYIRKWADHLPKRNILILDGDDFKENLFPPIRETESFLEIGHFITEDKFVFDKEKGFYCIKTNSALVDNNIACLGEGKGRKHPALSKEHKHALRKYFAPYNEKLYMFLGRKLNW